MPPISSRQDAGLLDDIAAFQDETASRAQLKLCGYDGDAVRRRVETGRWQPVGRAVVLHSGELTGRNLQWAAVLSVKGPAAVCGRTAAADYRLRGFDSPDVHVLVTARESTPAIEGVAWHYSRRFTVADISSGRRPAAVRPARAVIDAAAWTESARVACGLLAAAVQQRITPVRALREMLEASGQVQHRRVLAAVLADIEGGADSLSEIDLTKLARRAGLAPPLRQSVRLDASGRRRFLDADFGTFSVEVDGGVHLRPLNYWDDARRQNDLVLVGNRILRFPSIAIRLESEIVVTQLAAARLAFG
jgi:hypothetical protein